MADAVGLGLSLDLSKTLAQANALDKHFEQWIQQSRTLETNMRKALEINASGNTKDFSDALNHIADSWKELAGKKLSPQADTSQVEKLNNIMGGIIKQMDVLSKSGVNLFNVQEIYAANNALAETQFKFQAISQNMRSLTGDWAKLNFAGIGEEGANIAADTLNKRGIGTAGMSDAQVKALAEKEKLAIESELRVEVEKKAAASRELQWAKKTEDEKRAYIQKQLEAILKDEQRHINAIRGEYAALLRELGNIEARKRQYNSAVAEGQAAGVSVSPEMQEQNAVMLQEEQDLVARKKEIEAQYFDEVRDIAMNAMISQSRVEIEEYKRRVAEKKKIDEQQWEGYLKSTEGAISLSDDAKSINEEREAIKYLIQARDNLSKSTQDYDKIVKELNDRIQKHRISVEQLTKAEENENTLQPKIRNEYMSLLKEMDKVNDARARLAQTDAYKNGDAAAIAQMNAFVNYYQDLEDKKLTIEQNAQGKLDEVVRQHEAIRAQEGLRQTEKTEAEKKKIRERLGAISSSEAYIAIWDSKQTENIRQAEKAIEKLKDARAKLNKNDADYAQSVKAINDEISRQEKYIDKVINAEKHQAEARRKLEQRKEEKRSTYSGAMEYSKQAKSVNDLEKAIKYLEAARKKENLNTEAGRKNYATLTAELEKQKKTYEGLVGHASRTSKGLMDISGQMVRSLASLFSVGALQGYVNKLASIRGEFELNQRSLQTILQNKQEANEVWNKTVDLAVRSPFRVKELVSYTKQLAAYRIESDKLFETNKMLADVSAGLGVDMQRLILAFGQVKSAEFLRGTELRQFTEAGIPMLAELSRYLSEVNGRAISTAQVFDMISKRMVTFADVEEVFKRMTTAGGTFYNMQEIQSDTLRGQMSNLKDSVDIMLNDIGEATEGTMKNVVGVVKTIVDNWEAMIPVLKALIAAFAIYKITVLSSSKTMLTWARLTGVATTAGATQLSLNKMLSVSFKMLGKNIGKAASLLNVFKLSNPALLAITAIAGIALKAGVNLYKYNERLKEIEREHAKFTKSVQEISVDFTTSVEQEKYDEAREKLSQLIALAEGEYNLKLNIEVGKLDENQVQETFKKIENDLLLMNAKSEDWSKKFTQAFAWGNRMDKDFEQLNDTTNSIFNDMVKVATSLTYNLNKAKEEGVELSSFEEAALQGLRKRGELTAEDARLYDELNKKKKEGVALTAEENAEFDRISGLKNETQVEYFERLKGAITLLLGEYDSLTQEVAKSKGANKKAVASYEELKNHLNSLGIKLNWVTGLFAKFRRYGKQTEEATEEFDKFAKRLDDVNFAEMSQEDKERVIKYNIEATAEEKGWNDVVKDMVYELSREKWGVKLEAEPDTKKATDVLLAWQEKYNKLFAGNKGYEKISKSATTHSEVIKRLNNEYKEQKDLVERISKAGTKGAYAGMNLEEEKRKLEEINEQLKWLGVDSDKKATKSAAENVRTRIKLIEDMYKAYNDNAKKMGHDEAFDKTAKAFGDTFKEAFEGTGINLSGLVIDKKKLTELQEAGKDAGATFSEAMLAEMNKMAEDGTYIRDFDEAAIEMIKEREKFIGTAKDVEKKGKGYTIGYGEYGTYKDTGETIKAGDTITEEEALERLTKILLPKYRDSLNAVLEANNDLIFTQEQYNALLDLTYQGGAGATKNLLRYAKDEAAGLEHIMSIQEKVKSVFGEDEAARFGEAFVTKFKEAESVYERIALLMETMNLTVAGGEVSKDLYKGMQTRSDKRAAMFSGDVEMIELLRKAAVDVTQIDFTNIEGVVRILQRLKPLAEKGGKEATLAWSKATSEWEAKIGLEVKEQEIQRAMSEISEAFDEYQVSVKLKKMDVPKDFARNVFDVEYIGLDELKDEMIGTFSHIERYKGDMEVLGAKMKEAFQGNVDLLNRKMIPATELAKRGWDDVGEGIATVFSSEYTVKTSGGEETKVLVTPILPDGTVLSPEELESYVGSVLDGATNILEADKKGIVISVGASAENGEGLHKMQEEYYNFVKLTKDEQKSLTDELNKGLSEIDWDMVSNLIGGDQAKQIKKYLEDIAKMEHDALVERTEKYLKYTRAAIGKRAQIKLEELRKLRDIEETFDTKDLEKDLKKGEEKEKKIETDIATAKATGATEENIAALEREREATKASNEELRKRIEFMNEQETAASKAVRQESEQDMKRLDWEEFEKSDIFINMFEDLDTASVSLLTHMRDKLNSFKEEWRDMPLEDVQKIIAKLDELDTKLAEVKPWEAAKTARNEIKAARGKKEVEGVEAIEFESAEAQETSSKGGRRAFFEALDQELVYQEQKKAAAQEEIGLLEAALRIKEGSATVSDKELQNQGKLDPLLKQETSTLKGQLSTQKGIVEQADKQNGKIQKAQKNQKDLTTAQKAQREAITQCVDMANDLYGAFSELMSALGKDDPAMVFAEMGMNILSMIPQMMRFIALLGTATTAANSLGVAMNMAMGIIGLIVMAVQILAQAISAAVNYADKMRQMKLDVLAGQVENLKQKFDDLSESIDNAWSYKQLREYSKELDKVQKKMEKSQEQYITLLEQGDKNGKIDLAKQAQAKLDAGASVDSLSKKERKALLSEEYQEYKDATDALLEMQKDYEAQKQEILESLGGITDNNRLDAASDFVDAWLDAFKETGDGLSGLDESFDEFFEGLLKKKAAMKVSEKALQGWIDAVNSSLDEDSEGGYDITDAEQEVIKKKGEEAKKVANEILLGIFDGMEFGGGGSLSALEKGLQAMTEDTAQVLAAYWNASRSSLASIDSKMDLVLANMGLSSSEENPMLSQLRSQTDALRDIRAALRNITKDGTARTLEVRLVN